MFDFVINCCKYCVSNVFNLCTSVCKINDDKNMSIIDNVLFKIHYLIDHVFTDVFYLLTGITIKNPEIEKYKNIVVKYKKIIKKYKKHIKKCNKNIDELKATTNITEIEYENIKNNLNLVDEILDTNVTIDSLIVENID